MRVLVTGGAGYIGSIVDEELLRAGHQVIVYDSLYKGHADAVPSGTPLVQADLADRETLTTTLRKYDVGAVVHMAADSLVGESVQNPGKYYRNNVTGGICLLDSMKETGVSRIVFSSTAAVYGEPEKQPIEETDPLRPSNPYGETKVAFEKALRWYAMAHGLRYASLRYFNAAGASERFGEWHNPETHLIPLVLSAALGRTPDVEVFGDNYATRDGTCLRDYIHVTDLARAHVLALENLDSKGPALIYNLGCGGDGYTVREVIDTAGKVTGKEIRVRIGPRRPGDPTMLVASSSRIRKELGWAPEYQDLSRIIGSAWKWLQTHPEGYRK